MFAMEAQEMYAYNVETNVEEGRYLKEINRQQSCRSRMLSISDLLEKSTKLADFERLFLVVKDKKTPMPAENVSSNNNDAWLNKVSATRRTLSLSMSREVKGAMFPKQGRCGSAPCTEFTLSRRFSLESRQLPVEQSTRSPLRSQRMSLESCVPEVLIGCSVQYLQVSQRLMVNIERRGTFHCEIGKKPMKMFAKVFLMPGKIKQQNAKVTLKENPTIRHRLFFTGVRLSEVFNMELGVQLYVKKGLFKKRVLLRDMMIPLHNIDQEEPIVAWRPV